MSIKTYENQEQVQRNKGRSFWSGQIIKGTLYQAPTKLRVSSIPNKHENIVYNSSLKPAFGHSGQRILRQSKSSSLIGPGRYEVQRKFAKIQSKKGSGFFASKSKVATLFNKKSHIPGPGSYQNNYNQSLSASRKSKQKLGGVINLIGKTQAHQLFKNQIQYSKINPGVGQYDVNKHQNTKIASSVFFKSKTERFKKQQQKSPPIGIYQLSQLGSSLNNVNKTIYKSKIQTREQSFQQKCKRLQNTIKHLDRVQNKINNLGPGSYNTTQSNFNKSFKIKDNMYDRFGELKPIYTMAKSLQSQGDKFLNNQVKLNKFNNNPQSVFRSTSKKWDITLTNQMDPGKYSPQRSPNKKSHLINFQQKWV